MDTSEATARCIYEAGMCVTRVEMTCCMKHLVEQFTSHDWAVRTCFCVNGFSLVIIKSLDSVVNVVLLTM